MMQKSGAKKGKKKEEKFSLAEFLSEEGVDCNIPIYKEIENTGGNGKSSTSKIDISNLPTAPKSSFEIIVRDDVKRRGPPYLLYAKNIPFDCSEEDIQNFFEGLSIHEIRIILQDNRPVGAATVSFNDLKDYISALERDGLKLANRCVSLAQDQKTRLFDDPKSSGQYNKSKYDFSKKTDDQDSRKPMGNKPDYGNIDEIADWRTTKIQPVSNEEKQWRGYDKSSDAASCSTHSATDTSNWRIRSTLDGQTSANDNVNSRGQDRTNTTDYTNENWRTGANKETARANNLFGRNNNNAPSKYQENVSSSNTKRGGFNFNKQNDDSDGPWTTVSRR